VEVEVAYAMYQNGGDSGHSPKRNSSDQAAWAHKFPETLPVKGNDHPHDNSNKGKPCLGYEMQVIIMSIERAACKPWWLVLNSRLVDWSNSQIG